MSKSKIEESEYISEEEYDECDGMCGDGECGVCLYEQEKEDMVLDERLIECMVDMRKYMDTNYTQAGKKISVLDLKKLIKK